MDKVAIYCRLSEEDKKKDNDLQESESIQNQKSLLLSFALKNKWDLFEIYCDEDYSGIDKNRPAFKRLIDDASNKKFNIVLCKTQSRFTRDMEMVEKYIHHMFLEWGIRFVTSVDNVDTKVKGNKKARQINGLINEWYLEDLSENVRAVFDDKRKNGKFIGSYAPYGYVKSKSDHNKLVIDEEAAKIVTKIFNMRMSGYGMVSIAKWLNENHIPNPTDYRILNGYDCKTIKPSPTQHLWKDYTIRQILQRETYTGNLVQGISTKVSYKSNTVKKVPRKDWIIAQGTHEPIIQKEVFDSIQNIMKQYIHPTQKGQAHILAGKVRCMNCGTAMQLYQSKDNYYLRCKVNLRYGTTCQMLSAKYEEVTREICNQIQILIRDTINVNELDSIIREKYTISEVIGNLKKQNKRLNDEMNKISTTIFNLYADKVSSVIGEDQFVDMNNHFQKNKKDIAKQLDKNNFEIDSVNNTIILEKDKKAVVEKYIDIQSLSQECVDELINYIEIGVEGKKHCHDKKISINIYWNV